MNERIKKLAEQAGFQKYEFGDGYIVRKELERFAELVRQDEREVNENFEKMLFDMQKAAINLAKVNQELVEALSVCIYHGDGLSENHQSYLPPSVLLKAKSAIAKAEVTK
jgi:hypothetical protein